MAADLGATAAANKPAKDALPLGLRHTGTVIAHMQHQLSTIQAERQLDELRRRAVFEGVFNEIGEALAEALRVGIHLERLGDICWVKT